MKKFLWFLAAAAALMVVSCDGAKENVKDDIAPVDGLEFSIRSEVNVPAEGNNSLKLDVVANVSYEPVIDEDGAKWVSIVAPKSGAELSSITLHVEPQASVESKERETTITFKNTADGSVIETEMSALKVKQAAGEGVKVNITAPGKVEFTGGELTVKYTSNIEIEPVVPNDVDWIQVLSELTPKAEAEGEFYFKVLANETYEEKTATIGVKRKDNGEVIEGKTFDITIEANAE